MNLKHLLRFILFPIIMPGLAILASCENDIATVTALGAADTLPVETATNIEVIYSDSGNVQIWMASPELRHYEGKQPYISFPKGVRVIFYGPGLKVKSVLTAKYAVIHEKTRIMEARNHVEVYSQEKNEKLNSEHLVWDEMRRTIYTNEFVKITMSDKVLFGRGFESDATFENWRIKNPTGSISVNPD